ncbi:MAG: xanthine dehydrogenase family protein molybdopterin-binding subunit [Spirochaetota bacterium]
MRSDSVNSEAVRENYQRVTGMLNYVGDRSFHHVLHGAFVRLACARAKIKQIDTSKAYLPGVEHIFTAEDIKGKMPMFGALRFDKPLLAGKETKYCGEPVAVVFADTEKTAREAVKKVRVEYEELKPILEIEQSLAEGAPLVIDPAVRDDQWKDTNIMNQLDLAWGDVEEAKRQCAQIVSHTYTAPFIHHFALETYVSVASPQAEGVSIVTGIQHPFQLRRIIAAMLGISQNLVHVQAIEQGGAFGGRGYPKVEPVAAYFAYHLQRTIKISLNAEEGFMEAQRESALIKCENGFDQDGRMLFHDIEITLGVGAYTDVTPKVVNKAGLLATGPYKIPNCRITAKGVYTHTPPTTAFRGFGATHVGFALESQLNEAADLLKIDPIDIRMVNLPNKGEVIVPGDTPADGEWKSALEKLRGLMEWDAEPGPSREGRVRGKGVSIGIKNSVPATSSFARIRLNGDGSAIAYFGTTELGQGSSNTMARIVARELNIPLEKVSVVFGNTEQVPFDTLTASSRSTVTIGSALLDAAQQIKKRLVEIAAEQLEVAPERIEYADGGLAVGKKFYSYPEVIGWKFGPGLGEIEYQGAFIGKKDASHPLGGPTPFYEIVMTGAEVEVDRETGEVEIEKLITVSDVGTLINPMRARGVDEGGVVMGLGAAVMEHLAYAENGNIRNPSSLDYRIPTIFDVPEQMRSEFQENGDGPGPFGSKGLGEGGILGIAPALGEAIFQSAHVRLRSIPFTAESVWRALHEKEVEELERR